MLGAWVTLAEEFVILVDEGDRPVGVAEKLAAHRQGLLHRAFSIFVCNSQGQLMVQRRSPSKYHCGGLWTNTCCSHPRPQESTLESARRRLFEEMGFRCPLVELFSFTYCVDLDHQLTEYEYDHVLYGIYDGEPSVNPDEADAWRWVEPTQLSCELTAHPEQFTPWLRICWARVQHYLGQDLGQDSKVIPENMPIAL
ncbi:MAG: isopentenyl-diphosphate Delta-isomerase [Oscillatoriales cyanobacterium SM2_2_1]|nr:isopentenyl-diphosphate Delta-isomerase [Oscillatoriales cyanobacterium SM2_2_1]